MPEDKLTKKKPPDKTAEAQKSDIEKAKEDFVLLLKDFLHNGHTEDCLSHLTNACSCGMGTAALMVELLEDLNRSHALLKAEASKDWKI